MARNISLAARFKNSLSPTFSHILRVLKLSVGFSLRSVPELIALSWEDLRKCA